MYTLLFYWNRQETRAYLERKLEFSNFHLLKAVQADYRAST